MKTCEVSREIQMAAGRLKRRGECLKYFNGKSNCNNDFKSFIDEENYFGNTIVSSFVPMTNLCRKITAILELDHRKGWCHY